jgi:ArsR family transcriptional regulator
MNIYINQAQLFKALGDPNRLQILQMLCNGELCACKILEKFDITQPTLSHHMKILCDAGIVNRRKEGKWMLYSVRPGGCVKIIALLKNITTVMEKECSANLECGQKEFKK